MITIKETIKFHFNVHQNHLNKIAKIAQKAINNIISPIGASAESAILKNIVDPPNYSKSHF